MNIELKYPNLSQQVTQYVQELQIFKNAYQRLKTNDNNSDCAKIANENISARTEEKQSGNTDDGHNNYEINLSVNNESAHKKNEQMKQQKQEQTKINTCVQ